MNIIQKKKMMFDMIDTIKASIVMFGGEIKREYYWARYEEYNLTFYFNEQTYMKIHFNLYSNFISSMVYSSKYENAYMKKCFDVINATPKALYDRKFGSYRVYHCFKISRANVERLYNMFTVMARF